MILKFRVFLPNLMAMLTILLLGLAISWALRRLLVKLLDFFHFDRWSDRMGLTALLRRENLWPKPSLAVGAVVFWSSLLVFTMMALSVLKLEAVQLLISQSFLYLPRVVSAVLLVLVGYLVTGFVSRAVLIAAVNSGLRNSRLLAEGVRLLLTVLILAMSLEQLQVAPSIVLAAFSIAFGGIVLALAIAFGVAGIDQARKVYSGDEGSRSAKSDIEHI
jgi:hypothetical protein